MLLNQLILVGRRWYNSCLHCYSFTSKRKKKIGINWALETFFLYNCIANQMMILKYTVTTYALSQPSEAPEAGMGGGGGKNPPPPRYWQIGKPYLNQGCGQIMPTLLLAPPLSGFSDLPTVLNHRCIFLPLRYVESSFVVVCHLVWFDRQQLFFQNKKL